MPLHYSTTEDTADPDNTGRFVNRDIVLRVGHEELLLRQRYELLSIANDVLAGLLFLVGSFMFFSERTVYAATWLFVIGSACMLIRPVIRLVRRIHLQKVGAHPASAAAPMDF